MREGGPHCGGASGPDPAFKSGRCGFLSGRREEGAVFTHDADYLGHGAATLDSVAEQIEGFPFYRVHRGSLVHLKHIREVTSWYNGKYLLTMDDAEASEVVVSRNRVKGLKDELGL